MTHIPVPKTKGEQEKSVLTSDNKLLDLMSEMLKSLRRIEAHLSMATDEEFDNDEIEEGEI